MRKKEWLKPRTDKTRETLSQPEKSNFMSNHHIPKLRIKII